MAEFARRFQPLDGSNRPKLIRGKNPSPHSGEHRRRQASAIWKLVFRLSSCSLIGLLDCQANGFHIFLGVVLKGVACLPGMEQNDSSIGRLAHKYTMFFQTIDHFTSLVKNDRIETAKNGAVLFRVLLENIPFVRVCEQVDAAAMEATVKFVAGHPLSVLD